MNLLEHAHSHYSVWAKHEVCAANDSLIDFASAQALTCSMESCQAGRASRVHGDT